MSHHSTFDRAVSSPARLTLISGAARDLETCPFLVGHALARYRGRTGMAEEALAALLTCSVSKLHGLALCRRPSTSAPDFARDVARLAAYAGCAAEPLAAVLRAVDPRSAAA